MRQGGTIMDTNPAGLSPMPVNARESYIFQSYAQAGDIPFEAANALLIEHAQFMHGLMLKGGGPDFDYMLHVNALWQKIDRALPPQGSYYLVWSASGDLVGSGMLCALPGGIGELKNLHVRRAARGAGLGRELVTRRIEDARRLGMRAVVADTFAANTEMPNLYDSLGFRRVSPAETSATVTTSPELVDHMLFFRLELTDG